MTVPDIDNQVQQRLAESGVRYTSGRRLVVAALGSSAGPLSAAELHLAMGAALPLSSLYRSLMVLEDAGVLAAHFSTKGVSRYEMAEWIAGHHHHLVCVLCGRVEDIEISENREQSLHRMVNEVADEFGFVAEGHALEIEGRCRVCK